MKSFVGMVPGNHLKALCWVGMNGRYAWMCEWKGWTVLDILVLTWHLLFWSPSPSQKYHPAPLALVALHIILLFAPKLFSTQVFTNLEVKGRLSITWGIFWAVGDKNQWIILPYSISWADNSEISATQHLRGSRGIKLQLLTMITNCTLVFLSPSFQSAQLCTPIFWDHLQYKVPVCKFLSQLLSLAFCKTQAETLGWFRGLFLNLQIYGDFLVSFLLSAYLNCGQRTCSDDFNPLKCVKTTLWPSVYFFVSVAYAHTWK